MGTTYDRHVTGRWAEAIAHAWLIEKRYEVYVGNGYTSCDFIVIDQDKQVLRVEVKLASLRHLKWKVSGVQPGKFDILLVVLPDSNVLINPTIDQVYGVEGPRDSIKEDRRFRAVRDAENTA